MKPTLVLNTRPREQASELSRLLEAAGFLAVEAPAIEIVDAWSSADLLATRAALHDGAYAWAVLASANAGRALADHLANAPVLCGTATAIALGLEPRVALERFSARDAINALLGRVSRGERILVPRAEEGRDELVDGLRGLGAEVDAPIAYRTVPVHAAAERLGRGEIDIVTLCSPSSARSVGRVEERARVVCLGATTGDAARELGMHVDAVAASTSMVSLVMAVQSGDGRVSV